MCCQSFKLKLCCLKCMVGRVDPASFIVGMIPLVTAAGARAGLPKCERERDECKGQLPQVGSGVHPCIQRGLCAAQKNGENEYNGAAQAIGPVFCFHVQVVHL